jgi:quinol---cytochrome c reductase iron-sulfur subunit, bacillus type
MTELKDVNPHHSEPPRRGFFKKLLAIVIGGVVTAVPAAAAALVFLDPARRKRGGAADFVPITPLDALPPDGTPQRFQVIADRTDAWTRYRNVPLGAVYLKRTADPSGDDKAPGTVVAFNALCPHAGCFVDVARDGRSFNCPCHNSGFNADGSLKPGSASPRPLDRLEVDPEALKQGTVRVRFQNFVAGTHEKRSV